MRVMPAPITAARLAQETGVSLRSLYRDIDSLRAAGARIEETGDWPVVRHRDAMSILVADDNHESADSMALFLAMRGHDVRTVYDGAGDFRAHARS